MVPLTNDCVGEPCILEGMAESDEFFFRKLKSWVSQDDLISGDDATNLEPSIATTPTEKMLQNKIKKLKQENALLTKKLEELNPEGGTIRKSISADSEVSKNSCKKILPLMIKIIFFWNLKTC